MNTPLVNALGAALLHFVWEGAVLALLLAVALATFHAAKVRYALACAALLAMPVAFVATLALLYSHAITPVSPVAWPPAAATFPSTGAAVSFSEPWLNQLLKSARWFVPVWLAGIGVFYLRSAANWVAVVRLRRAGVSEASPAWQERVAELARRLRMRRAATLLESHFVDVPVVAGFLRPVILIPAGFLAGVPPDQLEYLLLHELAHIRRFDIFVNLLQKAIEGLLFYHPAVWWVSNVIANERENCCDDVVLSIHPEPGRYASALAALERRRWDHVSNALPAANGGNLVGRIRRILQRPERSRLAPTPVLAAAMLAISAVAMLAAFQQSTPVASASAQASAPWQKWLNEDAVYIIMDEERRAFNALGTDEEKEKFIEQFWERRDPTPATQENEFKEEHYRRIRYANDHFGSSAAIGWKSDRGRIYISFGPPDEIDSHPSCGTLATAFEDWRYRFIQGIGNNVNLHFSDARCTGEYRIEAQ